MKKIEVLGEISPEIKKSLKHLLGKHLRDFNLWEHTGSNRGPSACKADALNQLSYAPLKSHSYHYLNKVKQTFAPIEF